MNLFRDILVIGAVALCAAAFCYGGEPFNLFEPAPVVTADGQTCEFNPFHRHTEQEHPPHLRVICFTAEWCAPCREFVKPALEEVRRFESDPPWRVGPEETNHVQVLDVDRNRELAAQYEISSVPCFVRLRGETETHRHYGPLTARQICRFVSEGRTHQRE